MMFIVVDFISSKEVEVVPERWLNNNQVPWAKPSRLYAKKNLDAKPEWPLYDAVARFKNTRFETYEEANKKCTLLLENSSSETENLPYESRSKKSNKLSDFEYDSYEKSDDGDTSDGLLTDEPPTITNSISSSAGNTSRIAQTTRINDDSLILNDLTLTPLIQCTCSSELTSIKSEMEPFKQQLSVITEEVFGLKIFLESFATNMKRDFVILKNMLKEMPAISAAAGPNTSSASNKNEELKEITSLLPLSSLDDLNSFEQLLSENNNSKHFDTIISHIGGKNPDVHVSNAIKYCFTLELQKMCNWSGSNKKEPVKNKKIISLIISSICGPQYPITAAESRVKYVFQHTYDRLKSELKQKGDTHPARP